MKELEKYLVVQDSKKYVLDMMKQRGNRITDQRRILLDVIMEEECSCCKEIYYKAVNQDPSIGIATVYRMVNLLEELGVIQKKNICKLVNKECDENTVHCTIEFDDETCIEISEKSLEQALLIGLEESGYFEQKKLKRIMVGFQENDKSSH